VTIWGNRAKRRSPIKRDHDASLTESASVPPGGVIVPREWGDRREKLSALGAVTGKRFRVEVRELSA
jgi:hypothetical protein